MSENQDIPIMSYCGNCGRKLLENAAFCAYCGAQIPKIVSTTGTPTLRGEDLSPKDMIGYSSTFLEHFEGVLLHPKVELPKIVNVPNLKHAFMMSLIVGVISAISTAIFFSKYDITFSPTFFEFMPTLDEASISTFQELFTSMFLLLTPTNFLLYWIIYSFILWALHVIFASDLNSKRRKYRTIAVIVGWSFLPQIIRQIINIGYNIFFLSTGEMIYHSILDVEIVTTSPSSEFFEYIFLGLDLLFVLWSLFLVFYAIKALGSIKSNQILICGIYGFITFFFLPLTTF